MALPFVTERHFGRLRIFYYFGTFHYGDRKWDTSRTSGNISSHIIINAFFRSVRGTTICLRTIRQGHTRMARQKVTYSGVIRTGACTSTLRIFRSFRYAYNVIRRRAFNGFRLSAHQISSTIIGHFLSTFRRITNLRFSQQGVS